MKKSLLATFALVLFALPAMAFNPDSLAINLRKTLGLDTRMDIQVSTYSTPSGVGDLNQINVMIQGAPYPVYMAKDEKKYLFGGIVGDPTVDPDKVREAGIKLVGAHSQGSDKAPVTIVEYSDLQCSHCKIAHDTLERDLYKNYTKDQVRLVYKHFPLNNHLWGEPAAVASECASKQRESAFWEMNDYFFTNQEKISTDTVKAKSLEAAKQAKLDMPAFEKCLESGPVLAKVLADKKEGTKIGVNSTPSLFINGRNLRGFRNFEDIKVVIEEKLNEKKR